MSQSIVMEEQGGGEIEGSRNGVKGVFAQRMEEEDAF
jgi:hypothetical protein